MEGYIRYKQLSIVLGTCKQSINMVEDIIVKTVIKIITGKSPSIIGAEGGLSPSLTDSSPRVQP